MMNTPPVILSIAGSDPSGGAGIQADIKTVSALDGYAAAVLTAVTVQNTCGVRAVEYLSPELVRQQIEAVAEDLPLRAVKIGMTGTADIVGAVARALDNRCGDTPVVLDPVMISTSGHSLTRSDAVEALCRELMPRCRVATPNLNEAAVLAGAPLGTLAEAREAARMLHGRYGCAILIKGGHLDGERSTDILCDGDGTLHLFSSPRIETRNLHGTGCTLSSAIATLLGHGLALSEAVRRAKKYIDHAIAAARDLHIGHGHGPLWHFAAPTAEND